MALLDSILAFALTLAALATVATLVLEIAFRFLRLKRIAQLRMVEKLIAHAEALNNGQAERPPAGQDQRIKLLLANPFAVGFLGFVKNLRTYWNKASAFYEDISLEHTLRRLVDLAGANDVAADITTAAAMIHGKLDELALKYDEYCAALAVRYKQNAQRWSLVAGVVLAFALNVDGFRILEVYLQDPALREKAIATLQESEAEEQTGQTGAADAPAAAGDADQQALEELQQKYDELRGQVSRISGLDLPIGWSYFPWCFTAPGNGLPDPRCPEDPAAAAAQAQATPAAAGSAPAGAAEERFSLYLAWALRVLATGLLIGLGAPFWYDVARRLAAIRSAFGGKGTAEERHRGDDGLQSPWARKQLIERIVKDFLAFGVPVDRRAGAGQSPPAGQGGSG